MKTVIKKLLHHQKKFFLLLTIVLGLWTLSPLQDFQHYLSTGDHGRDLHAFQKTMEGKLPYRDYAWLFGPLMPYYYSLFFHLFGISIQSVLLGQNLLILLAGILIYLICATFLSPVISFICPLWYWGFRGIEFFHTYNHIGGIVTILLTLYALLQYLKNPRLYPVYLGSFSIFLLMLIRLNMGIAIFIAFYLSLIIIDLTQKKSSFLKHPYLRTLLPLGSFTAAILIYWTLLHPLPGYILYQSFPYGKFQRTDATTSLLSTLILFKNILLKNFMITWPRRILGLTIITAFLQISFLSLFNKISPKIKTTLLLLFTSLFIFFIFAFHEFIASGIFYRLHWVICLFFIIIFHLIFWMMRLGSKKIFTPLVQTMILLTLFTSAIVQIRNGHKNISAFKEALGASLHIGKNNVYTSQRKDWAKTVTDSVNFIQHNVPKNEKILAMPFDALYYFLTQRDSASRQLVFFEHIVIPKQQEEKIITDLEKQNVNWVILSSRIRSEEPGMGTLGKTYCPLIGRYLNAHFKIEAQFGDWENPGGWVHPHGTRILKRIQK